MNTNETIQFRFPSVRQKLQSLFPFDPKYDVEIIFKKNRYELQIAYLRLESNFFNQINANVSKMIKIQENFNEGHFEQIMKCFYGGTFKCQREKVFDAWKIFEFLKIQTFKKQTIKQIKQNFQKYNFFELMTFGFINNVEQIFSSCLVKLDSSNFSHLKQNKDQLLGCPLELFKFLINTHNRRPKQKRALNFIEINALLLDYCQINHYSAEFFRELKFHLIEKTQLTSQEYKHIFIQGVKSHSSPLISERYITQKSQISKNTGNLTQSQKVTLFKPLGKDQKLNWLQKLHNLKSTFLKDQNQSKLLKASFDSLSKSISQNSQKQKVKKQNLSKMQAIVKAIEKQIEQKSESLKNITTRIQKLQRSKGKNYQQSEPEQQQTDIFVESHIIPGNCLGQIINDIENKNKNQLNPKNNVASKFQPTASTANFSKKKKKTVYESGNSEKQKSGGSTQFKYKKSLIFDRQPISVPQRYLESLMKIMDDSFIKKKHLNLIFRRSRSDKNSIGDPSTIKNRSALLLLFETSSKKYAGGYISVEIPSFAKIDSLCDYQAYIFSLTHNAKMPIMKGQEKSAISLSKHYLLSFGNDLMISNDCLNEVSYCQWPGIYEVPKFSKCQSAKDLVGENGEFKIEQIQIYEVKNEEVDMII